MGSENPKWLHRAAKFGALLEAGTRGTRQQVQRKLRFDSDGRISQILKDGFGERAADRYTTLLKLAPGYFDLPIVTPEPPVETAIDPPLQEIIAAWGILMKRQKEAILQHVRGALAEAKEVAQEYEEKGFRLQPDLVQAARLNDSVYNTTDKVVKAGIGMEAKGKAGSAIETSPATPARDHSDRKSAAGSKRNPKKLTVLVGTDRETKKTTSGKSIKAA